MGFSGVQKAEKFFLKMLKKACARGGGQEHSARQQALIAEEPNKTMGRKQQTWEAKDSLQRWRKGAAGAGLFYALVLFLSAAPGRPEEPPATKPSPGTKEEPESSAKQNQPTLQELLSSPPWIKEILFRRSGNYTKISFGGESFVPYPGMLGYKGALQPSGFHLRHLANSATYLDEITPEKEPVFKNPKKGLEFIVGESKEHYWTLSEGHADLAFSYKDPKLGGDPRNSRQMIAGWKRKILIEVRRFGLEHMGRCDLKWTGRDQFSGVSEKLGAISGKIVARDDRERPTQLHYWPDGNLDGVVKVKYSYQA